jgi:hypothetical protein
MAERRTLTNAIHTVPNADPEVVRAFVTQDKTPNPAAAVAPVSRPPLTAGFQPVGLIPITVRLRPEIAGALKRASLERQLAGAEFFSQQEIVERALAAWLRENGNFNA